CFQSTPLSDIVARLSLILRVPPPRLLLLREEVELPTDSTVGELGISIADIIDCRAKTELPLRSFLWTELVASLLLLSCINFVCSSRTQTVHVCLFQDSPLGSVFSQYLSTMSSAAQKTVRFHFDGCKVTNSQTPAQLDMEDGDIIEVWT
uniref:NFATC2-interacting protein n=1 Tax=Stegastes partitus TaxID=144197 RepID=A0A3B5B523_9TELE